MGRYSFSRQLASEDTTAKDPFVPASPLHCHLKSSVNADASDFPLSFNQLNQFKQDNDKLKFWMNYCILSKV